MCVFIHPEYSVDENKLFQTHLDVLIFKLLNTSIDETTVRSVKRHVGNMVRILSAYHRWINQSIDSEKYFKDWQEVVFWNMIVYQYDILYRLR